MFPRELIPAVQEYAATGSRVICSPPPVDTDEDWVVLVRNYNTIQPKLVELGFCLDGRAYPEASQVTGSPNNFRSFSKGVGAERVNLIVTVDRRFYNRYVLATKVATVLNLTKKDDRVVLFEMLRDTNMF